MTATDFTGDSATDGGAISNFGLFPIDLTGVTISGNRASADGGGIYNVTYFDAVNTEITRNIAVSGGGIYDDASIDGEDFDTPTLTNSPVLDNKPDNCEPLGSIPGCPG